MKKFSKSPLLIALISLSMMASTVTSSSAYGANTPAQDQAAKDKLAAEKLAAEKLAQQEAQQKAQQEAQQKAQQKAQQEAQQKAQQKAQQEAQQKAQQEAQQKAQQKAQQEAQQKAQQKAQQEAQQKAQAAKPAPPAPAPPAKVEQVVIKPAPAPAPVPPVATKPAPPAPAPPAKVEQVVIKPAPAPAPVPPVATKPAPPVDKAAQEAKAKADQAAADKAKADKLAREAKEKLERKPAPQNPVGPPPVVVAKAETPAEVAAKLEQSKKQTAAQAAAERAHKDKLDQEIANQAAQKAADPKVKDAQKAKEDAAQKAADEKAKEIAAQKAQERKAIKIAEQAKLPVVVKTPQQIEADAAKAKADAIKAAQKKEKAKERIAVPAKTAEIKKENEVKAAEVEVAKVQKKEVVAVAKQQAILVKQNADIKQISQNPTAKITPAQEAVIAQNKKTIETRQAAQANKPVVAAPTHSTSVVELKTVNGAKIGLDPSIKVKVVVPVTVIVKPVVVVGGVAVASHMRSDETQKNIHEARIRSQNTQNIIINKTDIQSVTITKNITHVTNVYVNNYQNVVIERSRIYNNYYHEPQKVYRNYYSSYYDHGFRGGYAYPVRVDIAIHQHFWNPLVLWMFDDSNNNDFYCRYYGNSYCYSYPVRPFRYARVFYPTDTMRDLAIEVSGMSYYRHTYYRTALETLTDKLNSQISNYVSGRFYFGPNDIVINHYRNLGFGQVMVEGFVDRGSLHVAFKGHLDLENPYNSSVFVPTISDYSPVAAGIAVLNAIVALEQAANVRENVPQNVVYEEPAPPPMPVVNVTCRTFSGDAKFVGASPDSGTASQRAIEHCTKSARANATECTANISCDDGVSYAPVVSCSTSSTDANGDAVSFFRKGRDADYASQMAQQLCIADDATSDVDACSSPDNLTCIALDKSVLNPMACNVTVPNIPAPFSFQSYDSDKARNRAVSDCVTAEGTDVDDCNNSDFLSCDYVNAAPVEPPPPAASCIATGPKTKQFPAGQSYPSGPASDLRAAYNVAVKACVRANPSSIAICKSSAIENCPGAGSGN